MNFSTCKYPKKCKICGETFKSFAGLHRHLGSSEKIKTKDYYEKYYPRKDLYDNLKIQFKNIDDYGSAYFRNKVNERRWLERANSIEQLNWLKFCFQNRINKYKDQYQYSLVELQAMNKTEPKDWPAAVETMRKLNLKDRFKYNKFCDWNIKNEYSLVIDTREQKPFFSGSQEAINVGDYIFAGEDYGGVHVDRKSLSDFISTFASQSDRFRRECDKAVAIDAYLVVLVEADLQTCLAWRPPRYRKQRTGGKLAFHNVCRLMQEYNNLQFLFTKNREDAKNWLLKILSNQDEVKYLDLQQQYNNYVARGISL